MDVKFSDVMHFYLHLINVDGLALGTLDSVHCVLHSTFELAVRDDIIRKNPSDGVMREISKKSGKNRGIRRALTPEQQRAFMEYMAGHPIFYHWWPLFTILLGTGCRIGECLGLRWEDLDFENKVISINHAVTYYRSAEHGRQLMSISLPKTEAGIRTIPMLDVVKEAFLMEKEQQFDMLGGLNEQIIDGMSGFVFQNADGRVPNPQTVNRTIKRIVETYNSEELLNAAKEKRNPELIPNFSCHVLRHTFATRLCEAESNLKVIQSVMGHRKSVSFTGNSQLKIAWNDLGGVYTSLAKRIYATRNALVHSKSGQNDKLYKPLKHKEVLRKELPLVQVVAEMVIVKSSEVL